MDLHNNEVGREIYENNPNGGRCDWSTEVNECLDNGDMIVTDHNGNLVRSSE